MGQDLSTNHVGRPRIIEEHSTGAEGNLLKAHQQPNGSPRTGHGTEGINCLVRLSMEGVGGPPLRMTPRQKSRSPSVSPDPHRRGQDPASPGPTRLGSGAIDSPGPEMTEGQPRSGYSPTRRTVRTRRIRVKSCRSRYCGVPGLPQHRARQSKGRTPLPTTPMGSLDGRGNVRGDVPGSASTGRMESGSPPHLPNRKRHIRGAHFASTRVKRAHLTSARVGKIGSNSPLFPPSHPSFFLSLPQHVTDPSFFLEL